ncbi:LysR family transcriptional regulator [Mycolicibacterium diernhoferi]|uniref:Probable hydrogen peroxide-inducible genes activator n=3 Tax=Mycolicibacterium diernhoferi TaxID=1801 RepID=A0A1Q4HAI4_9MYCO|nr:LysR family transcriptional regulator [Mycolicibacterium diernhoferi]OJZ64475.1 transcriptional regulator [Mycolicibacterium diernhoferi]PEG52302.1 LysR family transcriptional regulator [Mycolicibacterium diernhoferi]QYL24300.1 LysR family transcriptional regulator [Mycolicibacterium diernhoferi]
MSRLDPLDHLSVFLEVARFKSFRAAADSLGVTPGAVSQAIASLERRVELPLFHRTTRHVSLTDEGQFLLQQISPAIDTIGSALEELSQWSRQPTGTLRLIIEPVAAKHVFEPVLPMLREGWPGLRLDVTVAEVHSNFAAAGFDAGIRIGSYIDPDMVAVQVSRPFNWVVLGSTEYFQAHGEPQTPEELPQHRCIGLRRDEQGDVYRWEFVSHGQSVRISPSAEITVNSGALMRRLAVKGEGLIYSSMLHASDEIEQGLLHPTLSSYTPGGECLYLYFPEVNRNQPKLRALVECCERLAIREEA